MKREIIVLPLTFKVIALAFVPASLYLSLVAGHTPLLVVIVLPLALIVASKVVGLKVEGGKIYLFRYTTWREIDPARIKGLGYLPGMLIVTVTEDWFTSAVPAFGYEANEMILKIREMQTKTMPAPAA